MIINEMAGSGGDLMPWMFRHRKIGTLVGKRTWGGLVHTADTPLFVDGGSMIAPRGGFFTREGKWAVENEGIGPDVDVDVDSIADVGGTEEGRWTVVDSDASPYITGLALVATSTMRSSFSITSGSILSLGTRGARM